MNNNCEKFAILKVVMIKSYVRYMLSANTVLREH